MPDCHSHPVLTEPHRRSSYFAPGAHLDHPTGRRPVEPQRPQLPLRERSIAGWQGLVVRRDSGLGLACCPAARC
jgi:hypothetical protein